MRTFFLLSLCLLLSLVGFAQPIKGRVTDGKTGEALPFVNIGVVGKALGTVSNEQGYFELAFQEKLANDTIRVSSLGHGTLNLTLAQLRARPELKLSPAPVALAEVQVRAKNLFRRTHTLGFAGTGTGTTLTLDSRSLGSEIGTVIYLKRKPSKILNTNFTLVYNHVGNVTFRANLYRLDKKGRPTNEKLVQRDIIFHTEAQSGPVTVDLTPDKLVLQEDFFLTLEWVGGASAAQANKSVAFAASIGYTDNDIYTRAVSQASWERISAGAVLAGMQPKLSFYVTVQD